MGKMLTSLLSLLALAYGGFAALLFFSQEKLAYYPQIGREIESTPRDHGLDYEPLTLSTADGERQDAWLIVAPELAADLYPWLPTKWLVRLQFDTRATLAQTRARVLVAHSPDDEIIPWRHGQRLFKAAPEPKIFLQLAGGHNDGFIFMRAAWVEVLAEFLNKHMGR